MIEKKTLKNKQVKYDDIKKCIIITETHETEVGESEILRRVQNIDTEVVHLVNEIDKLSGLIEAKKVERRELLKYITQEKV
jgi:uncharacterized membrane protein YjjP (DUF1212 family)